MRIVAHSYIHPKGAFLNGQKLIDSSLDKDYLKTIYTTLGLDYPKFYKMDTLSKMSLLGTFLLNDYLPDYKDCEDNLQVIFANSSSSQVTDLKYIDSYLSAGSPSPSLFVYTLPNIVTGELSIRYKWFGESIFFIEEEFRSDFFLEQAEYAISRGNSYCLCGWVESNVSGVEECFLFIIGDERKSNISDNLINILKSYRNE
ncbi:MAG: 3-oxoacyl-ACP synthase [Bacteroidota bacterium]|jgi:hypothetical protein